MTDPTFRVALIVRREVGGWDLDEDEPIRLSVGVQAPTMNEAINRFVKEHVKEVFDAS